MKKDISLKMEHLRNMADMLDDLSEKIDKQSKEAEAYENEFRKKNKMYDAFYGLKLKSPSLDEAEDFAVHILGTVLAKKTAGQTEEEIEKVFRAFNDKLMGAIMEFRKHYSYLLALGIVRKNQMKG